MELLEVGGPDNFELNHFDRKFDSALSLSAFLCLLPIMCHRTLEYGKCLESSVEQNGYQNVNKFRIHFLNCTCNGVPRLDRFDSFSTADFSGPSGVFTLCHVPTSWLQDCNITFLPGRPGCIES